ncbi:MAG: GPR endopeptidase [Clostridia bacterium]|nr:GPR endopeptidase [Clostridia bacterium]
MSIRTDLAFEMRDYFKETIEGVSHSKRTIDKDITVTNTEITTREGSERLGKPVGNYTAIEIKNMENATPELFEYIENVFCKELKAYLPEKERLSVLAIGLGNRGITADALGSKTIDKLLITRHLKDIMPRDISGILNSVCAIAPSVLGVTGIETASTVKSIVSEVKPDAVIIIDALASRSIDKIGCTIQITETGLTPGSGVGTAGEALTKKSLGCKVIAIGVPMVVYSSTMVHDVLEQLFEQGEIEKDCIKAVIEHKDMDMVVTPKEIDEMAENVSSILATGINLCLHPMADRRLIESLMF